MAELKIASPWNILYEEIVALFKDDPDVKVDCDETGREIKIYVSKINKAEALTMLMPTERVFGNITAHISVIPPNDNTMSFQEVCETAFAGNPCFAFAKSVQLPPGGTMDYLMFKPEAAQFYADDMFDYYGIYTMLYQDIARDIFKDYDPNMRIGSSLIEEEE